MYQEKAITVTQLATYFKQIFEAEELLFNISVMGEISGFKIVRGIAYFDLKDENALISCVCFNASPYENVKNGDKVTVKGTPSFYVKGGKLNFNVSKITPLGLGDIYQKFIELMKKLEKEGLFSDEHKKAIPTNVKRVGVITSQTGAVIRDIINVATRRNGSIDIVLYPAKVQGDGSDVEIIKGLDFFENYNIDVVIVARGGGSAEDLNIFNSEVLARRVYAFEKPIISAIGHETDFTIIDFVADVRAPTPSAAAELAVANVLSKKEIFKRQSSKFYSIITAFENTTQNILEKRIDEFLSSMRMFMYEINNTLILKQAKLEKLNPKTILKQGYAKVLKGEEVINSAKQVKEKDQLKIIFADGEIEVESIK